MVIDADLLIVKARLDAANVLEGNYSQKFVFCVGDGNSPKVAVMHKMKATANCVKNDPQKCEIEITL
jgi:hypothetical protein